MKEVMVSKGPVTRIVDSPIPQPNANQVLIKVAVSGSNPKDWKTPEFTSSERNEGDDIAGIVEKVGTNVTEFKQGDRVAAFHETRTPHGSYAEYSIAPQHTTFHIPQKTSFEEAATIPLAAITAAVGLFLRLALPAPWTPATEPMPLIIYGASSAVGAYAVQFATRSNIHPLLCVAGTSVAHVETQIDRSKGDTIVDYRQGDDAVVSGLKEAAGGTKLLYAFDAVSEKGSYINLSNVLEPGAKLTLVLPWGDYGRIPKHINQSITSGSSVHKGYDQEFGYRFYRYITRGLQDGWLKGHPQMVVPGGMGGVGQALKDLKNGKAHGFKYVFRIADTEGL